MSQATVVVTIAAGKVASDLEYFPVFIDMATLPATFWDFVKSDGGDLRARAMTGSTLYPIDIIEIDTTAETGCMFVRVPVKAAGNQFRIDCGDPLLTKPAKDAAVIGAYNVWLNFGPVMVGFTNQWARKQWDAVRYPSIDLNGNDIHATGGFARFGRELDPELNARSFSWIGKRTGGSGTAAIVSANGNLIGATDRETLSMRSNGELGLWNSVDGWLSAGSWSLNEMMQAGCIHAGTASRSIVKNGAIIATDTGCDNVPTTGNYKYFAAESNDGNAALTCKFKYAYMFRGVLAEEWYEFEYNNWFNAGTTLSYALIDFREGLNMSILYAATSIADVVASGTLTAYTGSPNKDTYVSEGIQMSSSSAPAGIIDLPTGYNDIWIAFYLLHTSGTGTAQRGFSVLNKAYSTANALFSFGGTQNSTTAQWYYWNGTTNIQADTGTASGLSSLARYDVHIIISDTVGVAEVYRNGILDMDFSAISATDTKYTAATTIDRIELRCGGVGTMYYSGVIVADEDTRGMRLVQRLPTGAGASTAWTGAYTDVDETGFNDADFIVSNSPGDVETFTFADLPTEFNGSPIAAVVLATRAQISAVSPTQIEGIAHVSSTDYAENPEATIGLTLGPAQFIFDQNPATLTEWTAAAINAAEFGVRSKV